jgi:hypothetical protein
MAKLENPGMTYTDRELLDRLLNASRDLLLYREGTAFYNRAEEEVRRIEDILRRRDAKPV